MTSPRPFRVAVIAQQVYKRYLAKQATNKAFRFFGRAVVMLERRCRRRIPVARRMIPERADALVG